jgi:(S)-3,5-dihydroxyphenylglycine transaminase
MMPNPVNADEVGRSARSSVMNFLNEIAQHFPDAISFASGRPAERFFRPEDWAPAEAQFYADYAKANGLSAHSARHRLAQYGATAGIVREEIAMQLRIDYRVPSSAERLVVTVGCQEAMALCILALCDKPNSALLVRNPTYIGATGVADAARIRLAAVEPAADETLDDALARRIDELAREGISPGAFYLIPDFDNPTGEVIDRENRERILDRCARHRIVVLEDNPYGMFRFEGESVPSMSELDRYGCVIHLGTFSKTLFPSVRVGSATFPESLFGDAKAAIALRDDIVERKSFLTVNTSQHCQALVGGLLRHYGGSLAGHVQEPTRFYRENRDAAVRALTYGLQGYEDRVSWNRPDGGFFLSVRLPFEFDDDALHLCATRHSVLVMPMRYFTIDDSRRDTVRIAFSNLDPERIEEGLLRFCDFAVDRMRSVSA